MTRRNWFIWAIIMALVIVLIVWAFNGAIRVEDDDTGKQQPSGPVATLVPLHEFYGPLSPQEEDDPGWNCLTQGGKSC